MYTWGEGSYHKLGHGSTKNAYKPKVRMPYTTLALPKDPLTQPLLWFGSLSPSQRVEALNGVKVIQVACG